MLQLKHTYIESKHESLHAIDGTKLYRFRFVQNTFKVQICVAVTSLPARYYIQ
jgi:hypothetical protein